MRSVGVTMPQKKAAHVSAAAGKRPVVGFCFRAARQRNQRKALEYPQCALPAKIGQKLLWNKCIEKAVAKKKSRGDTTVSAAGLRVAINPPDILAGPTLQQSGNIGKPLQARPAMPSAMYAKIQEKLVIGESLD